MENLRVLKSTLIFTGPNGSMGLTNGKKYSVSISCKDDKIFVSWGMMFCCPYDSIDAFLDHWNATEDEKNFIEKWKKLG